MTLKINRKTLTIFGILSSLAFYFSEIRALAIEPNSNSRILYIGDSHSAGIFGMTLNKLLRTVGAESVTSIGSCGSSPSWWYPTPKRTTGFPTSCGYFEQRENGSIIESAKHLTPLFQELLTELKPTHLIIEQGPNLWSYFDEYRTVKDKNGKTIRTLKSNDELTLDRKYAVKELAKMAKDAQNSKAKCIWVGQPDSRKKGAGGKLDEFASFVKDAVAPFGCVYFDSLKYTKYPKVGGDGLHYWGAQGGLTACHWAVSIFKDFEKATGLASNQSEKNLMNAFCHEYISACEHAKSNGKDVDCSY